MKSISHSLTGVIATSFLISTNPIYLSIASIVALLPDCDTSSSTLGRVYPFKFLAKWIEKRFPHRSITHSFLITGLITLLTSPLILFNPILWKTICLSYFIGWFGDVFTKSGVCAFYPSQARLIIPGNPRLRLSTNSPAEYWLISLFIIILIASFYLNNFGSITNFFNSVLSLPQGAIEQIKADLSNNLITVNVKGYNTITQEEINNNYEVVELITANDFLGKKDNLFYRIGSSQESNIISSKMKIVNTLPITQKSDKITIEDDDIIDYLDYQDNGKTYVSGNLAIDDAEDLIIPKRSDIFNAITLQPAGDGLAFIKINSIPLNDLKSLLSDYTGSGTIIIRTVELN